jgi:hypothetical protein
MYCSKGKNEGMYSCITRLTFTVLPWQLNRLFLGRPLLISENRIKMASVWPVKSVSRKWLYPVWAITASTVFSPEDTSYAPLFKGMVSLNWWNSIKIVKHVLNKIAIYTFGSIWGATVLGAGMFIITGHQPVTNKLLANMKQHTEYQNPLFCIRGSGALNT